MSEILKLSEIEREYILQVLTLNDDNRTRTSKVLGIGIRTLQRKLKKYGIPEGKARYYKPESEVVIDGLGA